MADKLLGEYKEQIESLTLIPSSGGVFEVELDEDLIFSKKAESRHTTWPEIHEAVETKR